MACPNQPASSVAANVSCATGHENVHKLLLGTTEPLDAEIARDLQGQRVGGTIFPEPIADIAGRAVPPGGPKSDPPPALVDE